MTILYFTCTGNNLYVAKMLNGELVSIPKIMKKKQYQFKDETIGLVFPVFGLSVPPLIVDFMKKAELKTDYLFAVLTYGTYDGGAVRQLTDLTDEMKVKFSYINTLHMQENYLPGFAMERQKKPADQDKNLKEICNDIIEKKQYIKHNSAFDRFMTWTHQKSYHYKRGIGVTEQYKVLEKCIGCGICTQVCPIKNIQIVNGNPVFGKDCISCLACIQNCPQNAISLSSEKSEIRYRNPEVSLEEIIHANK